MADRWHSVEELSEHQGVAPYAVYRWIAARQMAAHPIGRHSTFKLAEVDDWVRAGHAYQPASAARHATAQRASTR